MSTRLQTVIDDRVAEVVLNRPDKHNAVDMAMFDELGEVGISLAADRSVRAVVLRGAGENFCAGIDLDAFGGGSELPDGCGGPGATRRNARQSVPARGIRVAGIARAGHLRDPRASRSAPVCRLRWAPTFVMRHLTRSCRSWKFAGV